MNASELKIKACIGNYGYYAEGQLRDKWVTLPMKPADLDTWLKDNGLKDDLHEETYISDVECDALDLRSLGEESPYLMNAIAWAMNYAGTEAVETLNNALGCGIDAPSNATEMLNALINADEIQYYEFPCDNFGEPSLEMCGYELAESAGILKVLEDNYADCYFDFRAYAENELVDFFVGDSGYTVEGPSMDTYTIEEAAEIIGMND